MLHPSFLNYVVGPPDISRGCTCDLAAGKRPECDVFNGKLLMMHYFAEGFEEVARFNQRMLLARAIVFYRIAVDLSLYR